MDKKYIPLLASVLLVSACDENHAPIEDLGKNYYGQGAAPASGAYNAYNSDASSSYPHYNSSYSNTPVQSDSVPSVGTSDLPPPGSGHGSGVAPANNAFTPDNHVEVNSLHDDDPFKTPPSQPLAPAAAPATGAAPVSSQLTPQDKAIPVNPANATPADSDSEQPSVYSKDGISLIWPVNGRKIISHFQGVDNDGINIAMSEGEPIEAAASGVVVYSGNDLRDYGNMIIIRHDNGWLTAYANASKITAKKGAYVKQGDIIAYVGSTGGVKTPQLHFALRKGKTPVDPEKYLPGKNTASR